MWTADKTKLDGVATGATANIGTVTQVKVGTTAYNPTNGVVSLPAYPSDTNTAQLQVSDTTNKRISTKESTGNYIQFTAGTNKFTVSDGTNSFDVGVTPSISNNVTGSSLTANTIILGNGSSAIKTSSKTIETTLSASSDAAVPTSKAVATYISSHGGASIDDTAPSTSTTYSSQKIEELVNMPYLKSFDKCTDAELATALSLMDQGKLSAANFWAVGDEREVELSAMTDPNGVLENQPAQTAIFVILHEGGYKDINDNDVHFIVGMKNCLSVAGVMTDVLANRGWSVCLRRQWCNNVFYAALPSGFRSLFRQFKCKSADTYSATTLTTTNDYFAIASSYENGCTSVFVNQEAESNNLFCFKYYFSNSNRIKRKGTVSTNYYTRTVHDTSGSRVAYGYAYITDAGSGTYTTTTNFDVAYGISPFGCI